MNLWHRSVKHLRLISIHSRRDNIWTKRSFLSWSRDWWILQKHDPVIQFKHSLTICLNTKHPLQNDCSHNLLSFYIICISLCDTSTDRNLPSSRGKIVHFNLSPSYQFSFRITHAIMLTYLYSLKLAYIWTKRLIFDDIMLKIKYHGFWVNVRRSVLLGTFFSFRYSKDVSSETWPPRHWQIGHWILAGCFLFLGLQLNFNTRGGKWQITRLRYFRVSNISRYV